MEDGAAEAVGMARIDGAPATRMVGLIGGCSAESTALYYTQINRLVRAKRPGHGARLLIWSFDVEAIDAYCRAGDWEGALARFREAAGWLRAGGAEAIAICTNTMHRIADPLAEDLGLPLIHIIDETIAALLADGRRRPILLGTRFTLQEAFYRDRLAAAGLQVFTPGVEERAYVHELIYQELMAGEVSEVGRRTLQVIVARLAGAGADSVILACTELGLALRPGEATVPIYDTAEIHCRAVAAFALGGSSGAGRADGAASATRR